MTDYPIAHRINAGKSGNHAKDWYTRQQISVGNDIGDPQYITPDELYERDPTHHNYVSRFLGCHPNDGMNLHIGDNIIAYAPSQDILLGVGSITGEPEYRPEPRTLTTEGKHEYWRDIVWMPWSKPVEMSKLAEVDSRFNEEGKDRAFATSTLERYNGDFTGLKEAIESCKEVNLNRL